VIRHLDRADKIALAVFPDIIDVRSPSEFAADHLPGAINLPVLDDVERAQVGTIYVQQSRLEARKLGAALVARNIASHLLGGLNSKTSAYEPLIYCWRGGQRSAAMATVLDQIGWRPTLLSGGYRTYRRAVSGALKTIGDSIQIVLLGGHTGTAKTAMLAEVKALGIQTLDLEGLAGHRGSILGEFVGKVQPLQKMFESRLAHELGNLDLSRPVLVEAESSKIGQLNVPEPLWRAMCTAPMIEMYCSTAERAQYLVNTYRDLTDDPVRLMDVLGRIPERYGRKTLDLWLSLAESGDYQSLALQLMETHYDPAYNRWDRNHPHARLAKIGLDNLSNASLTTAAGEILRVFELKVA